MSSFSLMFDPTLRTTKATGTWPFILWGIGTTLTSRTSGCVARMFSTSAGKTLLASHVHLVVDTPKGVPTIGVARHHIASIHPTVPEALPPELLAGYNSRERYIHFVTISSARLSLWHGVPVRVDDLALKARKSRTYRTRLVSATWVQGDNLGTLPLARNLRSHLHQEWSGLVRRKARESWEQNSHCDEIKAGDINVCSLLRGSQN